MAFNPNKKYGTEAVPAQTCLLAMVSFERKWGKDSKKPYIRASFKIITGPSKNRTFFSSVGVDEANGGAMARLSMYCKAVGVTEAFELSDDQAFGDAFLGKPFKAKIKVSTQGEYTNNDVEKYVMDLTRSDVDAGDEFWSEWVEKHGGERDERDDDDFGGGRSGSDDFGGGGDDNIPF